MRFLQNMLLITGFMFLAASLSACNTAEGFGRDMQKAGEKIQGTFE